MGQNRHSNSYAKTASNAGTSGIKAVVQKCTPKTWIIIGVSVVALVIIMALLFGGGNTWVCDRCDTTFRGHAYYDINYDIDIVLCESCARLYWDLIPIETKRVDPSLHR